MDSKIELASFNELTKKLLVIATVTDKLDSKIELTSKNSLRKR